MHLVSNPSAHERETAQTEAQADASLAGTALVVLFAESVEIDRVREAGSGALLLRPPFHMGEEDAYLVLPDDIGEEIVDILRDGDHELLAEALRDGLIVLGEVAKNPRGRGMALIARETHSPLSVLAPGVGYATSVSLAGGRDVLRMLNTLPELQCTTLSAFVDDDGFEAIVGEAQFIGVSWRPPAAAKALSDIEPTHAFTRRLSNGEIGVELVLFREDEELVAVLRPASLRV